MTVRRSRNSLFFFSEVSGSAEQGTLLPPVDVHRTRHGWLIKMELAGVKPDDVAIDLHDHLIRIHGARRDYTCDEVIRHQTMEIAYQPFVRVVELPRPVDASQISLEFRDGMLLMRVTQSEENS